MNQLLKDELRGGWLGAPRQYALLDFLGIALGGYILWAGATRRAPDWALTSIGAIMVYIHTQRFVYAPQTGEGLRELVRAVGISPEQACALILQHRRETNEIRPEIPGDSTRTFSRSV